MSDFNDLILDDFEAPQRFEPEFAGFWIRVAAYIIDAIALYVVQMILTFAFLGSVLINPESIGDDPNSFIARIIPMYVLSFVIYWLYFALMESSPNQGTLGKMAVGIKVCDMEGRRLSFGRATGRHFAKIISSLVLLVGYIMVAFTEKKQGLHDMIASTLVVRK